MFYRSSSFTMFSCIHQKPKTAKRPHLHPNRIHKISRDQETEM
jgi:hypothetical protein